MKKWLISAGDRSRLAAMLPLDSRRAGRTAENLRHNTQTFGACKGLLNGPSRCVTCDTAPIR